MINDRICLRQRVGYFLHKAFKISGMGAPSIPWTVFRLKKVDSDVKVYGYGGDNKG